MLCAARSGVVEPARDPADDDEFTFDLSGCLLAAAAQGGYSTRDRSKLNRRRSLNYHKFRV